MLNGNSSKIIIILTLTLLVGSFFTAQAFTPKDTLVIGYSMEDVVDVDHAREQDGCYVTRQM